MESQLRRYLSGSGRLGVGGSDGMAPPAQFSSDQSGSVRPGTHCML
jgi:hypothetical protein